VNVGRLSSTDTTILKAAAILIIVLHNSLHPFFPKTIDGGNEFDFTLIRVETFVGEITANIWALPNMLLAAFGYCGVFLFFFLSAYGISVKYGDKDGVGFWPFMNHRITKILVPVLLVSVLLLLFLMAGGSSFGSLKNITPANFSLRLSLLSNFSFDQTWKVVGPWWFLSTIVQFYLVFQVINWGYRRYGGLFLIAISAASLLLMFFLNAYLYDHGIIVLRATVLGWLPEIALGCYFARHPDICIRPWIAAIAAGASLAVFVLGSVYESIWVFSSLAILLFMLIVARPMLAAIKRSRWLARFMIYTGGISVYMFLLSGIVREPFVHNENLTHPQMSLVAVGVLALVFGLAAVLMASQKGLVSVVGRASERWAPGRVEGRRRLSPELIAVLALGVTVLVEVWFIQMK